MIPLSALRRASAALFLLAAAALPISAQVQVDEKADQIAALKIELEQAKQARDRVIAKRWDDKQKDVEAREAFNQEYDDLKNKLDLRNQEADRLHADIQNLLSDAEEAQAKAEEERVRFLGLASTLRDKANEIAGPLGKSFPARVPERIQALNKVLKSADTKRDAPGDILADLMQFERSELALTREISLEHRGFTRANKVPGEGPFLRLGTITAAYRDTASGQSGLLLKNPPDKSFTPFDWREELPLKAGGVLSKAMIALQKGSAGTVVLPVDVLLTQNLTKSYTEVSDKGFFGTLFGAIRKGGVFVFPLILILIVALALFTQKFLQLRAARKGRQTYDEAVARMERRDFAGVRALAARYPRNLVLRVLVSLAAASENGSARTEAEKGVREHLIREAPRLERGLTTLSVMAAAAPMLGLLGTISGLIAMFQVITEMGVNDPKLLAGGIGEALVATETGLLIAIPTLLGHNFLANRVDDLVAEAEYRAAKTLNALWPKG